MLSDFTEGIIDKSPMTVMTQGLLERRLCANNFDRFSFNEK